MTNIHRDTLCELVATVGGNCREWLAKTMKGISVTSLQVDELWSFVGCKEKTRQYLNQSEATRGDCYTFTGMESTTKLIVCYHVGKRTSENAWEFVNDLYFATARERFSLTTDGFTPCQSSIPLIFHFRVDFAQVVKKFGGARDVDASRRYSPANILGIAKTVGSGSPDLRAATTSHIERSNLTFRMTLRRFTRLPNGFSKKWSNHEAMIALFAWYNYCRPHMTLGKKTTPAMAHGLTDHAWSLEELLSKTAQ